MSLHLLESVAPRPEIPKDEQKMENAKARCVTPQTEATICRVTFELDADSNRGLTLLCATVPPEPPCNLVTASLVPKRLSLSLPAQVQHSSNYIEQESFTEAPSRPLQVCFHLDSELIRAISIFAGRRP